MVIFCLHRSDYVVSMTFSGEPMALWSFERAFDMF